MKKKYLRSYILPVFLVASLFLSDVTVPADSNPDKRVSDAVEDTSNDVYEPLDSGLWADDTEGSADIQSAWDAYLEDPDHAEAKALTETAQSLAGTEFNCLGCVPETGFTDVSFIIYCMKSAGIADMKVCTREALYGRCSQISTVGYLPGDLIFFASGGQIVHVGICISETEFIHCGKCVRTDTLSEDNWWGQHTACFGRVCSTVSASASE